MARLFNGTSDYLSGAANPLSGKAGPWTVAFWIKPANLTQSSCTLMRISTGAAYCGFAWEATADSVTFVSVGHTGSSLGTSSGVALTSTHVTNGAWIAYRYNGASSTWDKFLNGVKTSVSSSITSTLGSFTGGIVVGSQTSGTGFFNGTLGEIAIWESVALTDQQILDLASGIAADVVADGGLSYYWPLRGNSSPEPDYAGATFGSGNTLTVSSGTTTATHPVIYSPGAQIANTDPTKETKAWLLDVIHSTGTRRYSSLDLSHPLDLDVTGAQYQRAVRNASQIEVVSQLGDGMSGFDLPTTTTVSVDNSAFRSPMTAMRPSLLDTTLVSKDPVAWWRFGESSGTALAGEIGTHNATAYGTLTYGTTGALTAAGDTSTAITFPGTASNYASAAAGTNGADFDIGLSGAGFSLVFWAKLGSTSQASTYVIDRANKYSIIYGYVSQKYEFYSGDYTGPDNPRTGTGITVSDTNWHHLAFVYYQAGAASRWVGFLDGAIQWDLTKTFTLKTNGSGALFFASAAGAGNWWSGSLQDVALYKRALSDAEITTIYQAGKGQLGLSPLIDFRRTPCALRKYDRSTHEYRTVATGMIADCVDVASTKAITITSHDDALFQTPVPRRIVNVDEFPSATDLGAAIPRVYGEAFVSAPYCGADRGDPGGDDYLVSILKDASDSTDQIDVKDFFWDTAPQDPGLESAVSWTGPGAVTYASTTTFTMSGDYSIVGAAGFPVRAVTSTGIWSYSYLSTAPSYSGGTTTFTTVDAILTSSINTGGCVVSINPTPTAGGSGYAVGDLLSLTTGGTNCKVRVVALSGTAVSQVRLVQPGSGYTTGTGKATSGGTGSSCTIEIAQITTGVQLGDQLVEKNRYTTNGKACASIRFLGGNQTGVVVQAVNTTKSNPATCLQDVLKSSTFGLGQTTLAADFTTAATAYSTAGLNTAVNGALGGDKQQVAAGDVLREWLQWRGSRLYYDADQAAWRITVDTEQTATAATLGYSDGYWNNVKSITSYRRQPVDSSVSLVDLRYGMTGRVRTGADGGNVYLTGNDYKYRVQKTVTSSGAGKPLVVTSQWLTDYASASKVCHYLATRLAAEDEILELRTGQAGLPAPVGSLVAIRIPHLGLNKTMRVRRCVERLHEADMTIVGYDRTMYDAASGIQYDDGSGKLTQADSAALVIENYVPGVTLGRIVNSDFLTPIDTAATTTAVSLPGYYFSTLTAGSTLAITADSNTRGGNYLGITLNDPSGDFAMIPLSSIDRTLSSQYVMSVVPGVVYIFSAYSDQSAGWVFRFTFYDSGIGSFGTSSPTMRVANGDANGLGWKRYYAIARAPIGSAQLIVSIRGVSSTLKTFNYDALMLEAVRDGVNTPSQWIRYSDPRTDPAVIAPGLLQQKRTGDSSNATQLKIANTEITLSGSSTSATNLIPAGAFVFGVTAYVSTAITGTATSWSIDDGTTADLWGTGLAKTLGTTTNSTNFKSTWTPTYYSAAKSPRVVAAGGTFSGGKVVISVHYVSLTGPSTT